MPTKSVPDARLIGRRRCSALAGGLSGFCCGPAVAALATGLVPVFAFVVAMMAGMIFYWWILERPVHGGVLTAPTGSQSFTSCENPS